MEDVADLLGAVVGDFHTDMRLICREGLTEAFLLTLREPITRGAQKIADLIERITLAPAVTGRVLLDAATHLVKGVASELDDMEGVEDAGGVLELIVDGVLVSLEGIQCGAGKTTTFQILLGLVPPETGEIRIFGKPYTELTAKDRERIGVSLADSGFSQFLTVRDVTAILRNLYTRFDETRFLEKCQRYELPANKKIKDFSTGMQAKLKLLIATSHDADLLILDEPTLGLDVMSREAMLEELQEYLDSEGTGGAPRSVLISSHISSDLEKFCDDIYMIDRGRIVLHGETDVLLDSYGILKVDERQYQALDRRYLLAGMREAYGYRLLTNERRYYQENYPDLVMEKGSIDDILILTARGKKL